MTVHIPLFVLQLFSCFFMTGLIWNIQVTSYPAFEFVGEGRFQDFHHHHSEHITWVVLPMMALELVTGAALAWVEWDWPWAINLGSILLIWLATAFLSVPIHEKLGKKRSAEEIKHLINTNWVRTVIWSARTGGLCYGLVKILQG